MIRPFSSSRFSVRVTHGAATTVVKTGPSGPLAREARALHILAGNTWGPALVAAAPGRIETVFIDGTARQAVEITNTDARRLGAMLCAVHDARTTATGGLPEWPSRARSLAAYHRARLRDAIAAAGDAGRLAALVAAASGASQVAGDGFRLVHGDLTLGNILWDPHPRLIDWEFWRMGDPAEDLAYLAEVNALPAPTFRAVLRGYGDPGMGARVDRWRALVALDAGLWFRDHGEAARASELLARARTLVG